MALQNQKKQTEMMISVHYIGFEKSSQVKTNHRGLKGFASREPRF